MLFFFLPLFLIFLMIGLPVFFGMLAAPGSCSGSMARSATSRCFTAMSTPGWIRFR
jgi:hypothetical protein